MNMMLSSLRSLLSSPRKRGSKPKYLFFALFLILSISSTLVQAEEPILNVYTWSGYLPESVIHQFQQETGIRVNHSTYASNEALYSKLKANPDIGYDIIIPSADFVSRMIKQDLLQPLDKTKLHYLKNLNPTFLNKACDPGNLYSLPYLWNAYGIAVNQKYHNPKTITSWNDLWQSKYKEQLLAIDDTRIFFSMGLVSLGYSENETNPKKLNEVFLKLKDLMNNIKVFNLDAQKSIYIDEDITLGMALNGDIYLAQIENPNLQFIFPKEGFVIALDSLAIPKGAKHSDNAHRFIDFVLQAEVSKQISLETGFSTPNRAAELAMPDNIRNNPFLYPTKEIMKRGKFEIDVGEAARLYEHYFERLKMEH